MRIANSSRRAYDAWLCLGVISLFFVAGFLVAQWGWYRDTGEFVQALLKRPGVVWAAYRQRNALPTLSFDLDFEDYQHLESRRARALRVGASLVEDADYVPAQVSWAGGESTVNVRLPQVEADALVGRHWPLEVVTSGAQPLLAFDDVLLTPVREDALLTYGYLGMLRDAGFPVVGHRFVYVMVNGVHWGLYLLESRSVPEGLAPNTVVVSFNSREFLAAPSLDRGDGFAYAQVEVMPPVVGEEGGLAYAAIVGALRAIERGDVAPSQYFDAEALGRFLAITALWYGSPALDWRTMRLAYDPVQRTFMPIGVGAFPDPAQAWPEAFTDDPYVQRAYARALRDLSGPTALDALDLPALEALRLALGADLGYPSPPWDVLASHQAEMRSAVSPSRTLFATLIEGEDGLRLSCDALLPFPVEILGLDFGELGQVSLDPTWVDESSVSSLVVPAEAVTMRGRSGARPVSVVVRVPLEAIPTAARNTLGDLSVVTRIWGLEDAISVPVVWGYSVP